MKPNENVKGQSKRARSSFVPADVEELLRLYRAWFTVLLRAAGKSELHVCAADVTEALRADACSVEREDGGYVIRLRAGKGGAHGGA